MSLRLAFASRQAAPGALLATRPAAIRRPAVALGPHAATRTYLPVTTRHPQGLARRSRAALSCRASSKTDVESSAAIMPASESDGDVEVAVLGMGCFWEPQAVFSKLPGVISTSVGYTGGMGDDPTYGSVCSGDGHTEAIKIEFRPSEISYKEILDQFWSLHSPTQYQVEQYQSAIWPLNEQQEKVALDAIEELQAKIGTRPVATKMLQPKPFYKAEWYHQHYNDKNKIRLGLVALVWASGAVPGGTVPGLEIVTQALIAITFLSFLPQLLPAFDKVFSVFD